MRRNLAALATVLLASGATLAACADPGDEQSAKAVDVSCRELVPGSDIAGIAPAQWGLSGTAGRTFGELMQASSDLAVVAGGIRADVDGACTQIALDLGGDPSTVKDTDPAARTVALCKLAAGVVNSKAAGAIAVAFQPPVCTLDTEAQSRCEVDCAGNPSCALTPAAIVARCDPSKLSGLCTADCRGRCDGSANLAIDCDGECSGVCEGACDGTCSHPNAADACGGSCTGTCKGPCRGSCKPAAGASMKCDGDCTGGCSVALTAPRCTADLKPPGPPCNADVSCAGYCAGRAAFGVTCTSTAIDVVAAKTVDARVVASLALHLPAVIGVFKGKLGLIVTNVNGLAERRTTLQMEVAGEQTPTTAHLSACLLLAGDTVGQALANLKAAGEGASALLGAVGID